MTVLSPKVLFSDTVFVHESAKISLDPDDPGNWFNHKLVGSKYGVTGAVLAAHRGRPVGMSEMMNLKKDEAMDIALDRYYHTNGLDTLPWDRIVASVVDLAYNAGPKRAMMELQEMIGSYPDGAAGPNTLRAYNAWKQKCGSEDAAARVWCDKRIAFYRGLNKPKYINGWTNRARSFLPGTPWWKKNA